MEITNTFYPSNRKEWRDWLTKNHASADEIWVIYYKKHTNKPRIPYNDAVEEALCFGWIDGIVKKIDDEKYCQRFTPRNEKSEWSKLNKSRVAMLIKTGKMTEFGLNKVNIAKKNGMWKKITAADQEFNISKEFEDALENEIKAKEFFNNLPHSHQKRYIGWISSAKKEETKFNRITKSIELLKNNKKLGMV